MCLTSSYELIVRLLNKGHILNFDFSLLSHMIILPVYFILNYVTFIMTTARDIMSKKIITLESDVSASDIAKLMDKNKVSSIIVMKDNKPYGIISERDMVSKVVAQNKRPSEIKTTELMSSPLMVVNPLTPVDEVAEKMILNKIRRVVVSDDKQTLGIVTVTDFVKHLHSMLSTEKDYNKDLYKDMIEDWEYWAS